MLVVYGAVFVGSIAALLALRWWSKGRYEVKLTDAVIAVIPVVFLSFLSGHIGKIAFGTEGFTVERASQAILAASDKPIDRQVDNFPEDVLETADKAEIGRIPEFIDRRIQGLEFTIGSGIYAVPVVREYLSALTRYPFFQYVIINDEDGALFGMIGAGVLYAYLSDERFGGRWDAFTDAVNRGRDRDQDYLLAIPGFVPGALAVTRGLDKRAVLERMDGGNLTWLPVVDDADRYTGIVERSRLTASLILDVAAKLEDGPAQ